MALVRDERCAELIEEFRRTGDASLKRRLPAFIFQATFDETLSKSGRRGQWRKQAATRLTGLVVMDIDHLGAPKEGDAEAPAQKQEPKEGDAETSNMGLEPKALFARWQQEHPELLEGEAPTILLVFVTPSGKGLKVVFKADAEKGNLIDNQHAMAEVLGVEVDESCKDASRMSFVCREQDILHLRPELFAYEDKAFAERYNESYRNGRTQPTAKNGCQAQKTEGKGGKAAQKAAEAAQTGAEATWRGYSLQRIIDERFAQKLPCREDSNRHKESLQLASDLLAMLDGDREAVLALLKEQPWVQEIISERQENVAQTVDSAAEHLAQRERKFGSATPGKAMQEAILRATGHSYREIANATVAAGRDLGEVLRSPQQDMLLQLQRWGEHIEALMAHFPLLRDICRGLKPAQYPAAMFVGGGLLMTLMTRCTYRFYHRPEELRRLNCSALIIGDPASGKSFATRLYKLLSEPIVEADKVGRDAINAYRELTRTKGANKEKPRRPKVVVRVHPARTSNAQFIQDMVNAVEIVNGEEMQLHMLTFDTELDNTLTVQRGGSWIDKQSLQLKAFHNEEDGQAYSNMDSVMQDFNVVWNYIYTGTPVALRKMVNEQNFGSGLATRLTCIPLPPTNFEMMDRQEDTDTDSDERLSLWARRLDRTKGELSLGHIVDELYDWTARRMADAKDNDSRADEMLLKRCAYHGLNFAAPYIVMRHWDEMHQDGDFWCGSFETDERDWELAELMVNIQLACQRHFFGTLAQHYFEDQLKSDSLHTQLQHRTLEAYSRLPELFTAEDVLRCFNLSSIGSARVRLTRMVKDHQVERLEEGRYRKRAQ
ncbi:MAG: hypothetical protein K6C30_09285 [Bacteroidaceae bacterium]|nr:hypothetical protein [Bacteroidaceae bacterium]